MPPSDDINLLHLSDQLKVKTIDGKQKVFDPIRKKWYVLRPEEFVRQLIITHLMKEKGYPLTLIAAEKQLKINNSRRRFDLVVFDKSAHPIILVECKSPKEKLNQSTALQIANYNISLKARYLWLTNGRDNYFYEVDFEEKSALPTTYLPSYKDL